MCCCCFRRVELQFCQVHGDIIDNYLKEEIDMGSITGPFANPPIHDLHINRFGVIPKSTFPFGR